MERIVTAPWMLPSNLYAEYERTAQTFGADAWMIGRVSMEPYAGRATLPKPKVAPLARTDFIAGRDARSYAIALDPAGKLRWRSNDIDGEHVVTVSRRRFPTRTWISSSRRASRTCSAAGTTST